MGKRYYCEYCDRHFADSPGNRRNHINGVQHKRNRKMHYDSFKDPLELLAEESQKLPCRRFFQTGSCDFGDNCRYSHTNPQLLLERQARARSLSRSGREPILHEWLARWERKRKYRQINKTSDASKKDVEDGNTEDDTLSKLPPLSQLPPSMLPPPPEGYPKLPKVEWG